MYQLMLVTCIGMHFCEYTMSPIQYDSMESCTRQAAIVAGMAAGKHHNSAELTYRYRCAPGGDSGEWYAVAADGSVSRYVWKKPRKSSSAAP